MGNVSSKGVLLILSSVANIGECVGSHFMKKESESVPNTVMKMEPSVIPANAVGAILQKLGIGENSWLVKVLSNANLFRLLQLLPYLIPILQLLPPLWNFVQYRFRKFKDCGKGKEIGMYGKEIGEMVTYHQPLMTSI